MKGKKVGNNFEETSRKSRVKMHKSGKHWVRTVMSQIGLMRLFKGAKVEEVAISQVEETLKDVSVSHHILKSAAALGAIAAGGVASQTALAEETPAVETEASTDTLAGNDVVAMSSSSTIADDTASQPATVTEATTTTTAVDEASLSLSSSESLSTSSSLSESQLLSASLSESVSESISESTSESISESESVSSSESQSQSESSVASETSTSEASTSETSVSTASETSTNTDALVVAKANLDYAFIVADVNGEKLTGDELVAYQAKVAEAKALYTTMENLLQSATATQTEIDAVTKRANELTASLTSVRTTSTTGSIGTSNSEASSEAASSSSSSSSSSTDTSSSSSSTEAREVLEQVTSEAEILVQIANGQTTPSQELTDAVAVSTKDIAAAKLILGNTEATAEEIQTVVNSVQNSSQALGALLIKDDEDGIITFALDTTTTATVTKVGEGYGVLVDKLSTASPSMDNANGATVTDQTVPTPFAATTESGWHTFGYYSTETYDATQVSGYDESDKNHVKLINGTAINAYVRYSLDSDPTTYTVLAELVDRATGNVVESYQIEPGSSATFTYPTTVNANNQAITILYDSSTAIDGSPGSMRFTTLGGTTYYYNNPVPAYSTNTTYYKTTDGTTIATYTLVTIGGQTVTASGVRTFVGYDYSSTTKAQATVEQAPGTVYLFSKIESGMDALKVKSLATVVDSNGAVRKGVYIEDPSYTGKLDW